MTRKLHMLSVLIITLILTNCMATNPLAGVDIPEPEAPETSYYFFRAAQVIFYKQADKLPQAKEDLELVLSLDQNMQFPEAYPFLVECYQRMEIIDSAGWIYEQAQLKFEANEALASTYSDTFKVWQSNYPEFPEKFTTRGYRLLDSTPEPIGGFQRLYHNLEYPEMARSMNRSGTSYYTLIVKPDGSITDIHLLVSSYPDLDEAALAAIKKTSWVPAKYRDKPVPFQLVLPIQFRL